MAPAKDDQRSCVFCDIVAGKAPSYKIAEDALSLCILDINPFTEGHCLVITKRHVVWWHEMTEEETASLYNLARRTASRMMETFKPDFVCQYARGRRIPHTHLFLIPSYSGDPLDRFFNALEGFQESPRRLVALTEAASLGQAAAKLREP
jgi:histidine triad (HIT) family protein